VSLRDGKTVLSLGSCTELSLKNMGVVTMESNGGKGVGGK
jgi:hypothetical protein